MILLLFISILLLFLIGLLVLPTRLILDSEKKKYFIEIPIYFRAQLIPDNQLYPLKIRLFFIPIKINPFQNKGVKKKKLAKRKKNRTRSLNIRAMAPKALKLFTIKKAIADVDTGDFPLNAQLIPITQLVNNRNIHLQINFENRNNIDVEIFTRLYKLIWIGITNKSDR